MAKAVRGYHTGSISDPHDLTEVVMSNVVTGQRYPSGTQTYVSDIENRLTGGATASSDLQRYRQKSGR